jgi:hypothetical protein
MIGSTKQSVRRLRKGQSWKDNGFALSLVGVGSAAGLGFLVISAIV